MEEDNQRKTISDLIENSIFMDAFKITSFLEKLDKMSIIAEKVDKQKVMKIRSGSHQDSYRVLRMLLAFFKIIGLATFAHRIVKQKKRTSCTFQYSELGILYNAVLISLMIASNYLSIPFRIDMEYENKTNLTEGIEILQTILGTVVICTILFSYCIDQKSLVRIANRLMDVEHEIDHLYRLYHPLQRQRVLCSLIIICILKGVLLIVLLTTEVLAFHSGPISWLTDILPTFHVGWLMLQYFVLITILQADFADVNRAIQSLSRVSTPDLRPQSLYQTRRIIVSNSTVHQLLQLRDAHCHLCEISENVSDFYSLPILFGITFFFLTFIYNGYYLLSPLLMSDEVLEYEVFSNTVFWLIFLMYPISLLTNRITKILLEMEKTGSVVHNLLSCAIGKEAKSEVNTDDIFLDDLHMTVIVVTTFIVDLLQLKQFSLQLLHRKIHFTANGYFALDNTFLHSLIGTVATYLVILVQFQMGSQNMCSSKPQCNCTDLLSVE